MIQNRRLLYGLSLLATVVMALVVFFQLRSRRRRSVVQRAKATIDDTAARVSRRARRQVRRARRKVNKAVERPRFNGLLGR